MKTGIKDEIIINCRVKSISASFLKLNINLREIYKLLRATIGSNCDALFAGKTPKIRPIDPDIIIVDKVVVNPTEAGNGVITPNRNTPVKPVVVPTRPPIVDKISASNKNCIRISDCFAPIAFLKPISSVLSLTETSIIFIIPIPPTMSDTAPIPANKNVRPLVILVTMFRASS